MKSKNVLSRAAALALVASLAVVGGCASNAQTDENTSTAQEALQTAQEARDMAQEALDTARAAQRAADESQRCCTTQQEKLDRLLERSQQK